MQICAQRPSAVEETSQLFRSSSDCARVPRPHYAEGPGESLDYIQESFPHSGLQFERELTPTRSLRCRRTLTNELRAFAARGHSAWQLVCLGRREARTFSKCRSLEKGTGLRLHSTPGANRDPRQRGSRSESAGLYCRDSLENLWGDVGAQTLSAQTRSPGIEVVDAENMKPSASG